jgi:hypothetical protein
VRRALVVTAAVLAAAAGGASRAAAQDSVFGIRGLGFLDRAVSTHAAGAGDAFALFDGASPLNPAAVSQWTGTVGWADASSSGRSFDPGTGAVSLRSTRFPLVGFASPVTHSLVVAVTASDYLDRNWAVSQTDTVSPRDTAVVVDDETRSLGGVSDLQLALGYRLGRFAVGLGLHALSGSSQTFVTRKFPNDSAFVPFAIQSNTTFRGVAVSFGAIAAPSRRLLLAAALRFDGRLRAETVDTTVDVRMPVEFDAGASWQPTTGLAFTGSVGYGSWSRASTDLVAAGQQPARNAWSADVGAEVGVLRLGRTPLPLRVGYRWRQLPFLIPAQDSTAPPVGLTERAFTVGFGLTGAGGRATVDVAFRFGSRAAGGVRESFTTTLVGLTVVP